MPLPLTTTLLIVALLGILAGAPVAAGALGGCAIGNELLRMALALEKSNPQVPREEPQRQRTPFVAPEDE